MAKQAHAWVQFMVRLMRGWVAGVCRKGGGGGRAMDAEQSLYWEVGQMQCVCVRVCACC